MEAIAMTHLPTARKAITYHVGPWRYIWLWFVFGPLALVCFGGALWSDATADRAGLLIAGGMWAVLPVALQAMIFRARLTLSGEGLCLRQIGYRIEAPWSDIAQLRLRRGREGFVTAHPIESKGMRRLADAASAAPYLGMNFYDAEQNALLAEHRFIPIEAFAWHLRSGTMRRELVRVAPHLRHDLTALTKLHPRPAGQAPADGPKPSRRQKLIGAAILVAVVTFWAVLFSMGDRAVAWFATIAYAMLSPFIALGTGINAWSLLKRKSWLMGFLLVAMTLIAICWTILDWSRLQQLLAASGY